MKCEPELFYRPRDPMAACSDVMEVLWCHTHKEEMLTGLRCRTGWDEEIAELRNEIAEIKLTLNRRMVR